MQTHAALFSSRPASARRSSVSSSTMMAILLSLWVFISLSSVVVQSWQTTSPMLSQHYHYFRFSNRLETTSRWQAPLPSSLFSTSFNDINDDDDETIVFPASKAAAAAGSSSSSSQNDNPSSPPEPEDGSSALLEDADYTSFQDIDFNELDPLTGMTFEEYEKYLTSSDTPIDDLVWDDSVPTINQLYVVGRVGNTPEARYLPDNNVVVSLSIALPRYYNYWEREDLQVEYGQEETEWYNLECWGQLGEFVLKNVEKGTRVGVIGAIDQDYYPNKSTGKLSSNCKVLVQDLDILESKMEAASRKETQRGPSLYTSDEDDDDDDDDDFGPGSLQGGSAGGFFDPF